MSPHQTCAGPGCTRTFPRNGRQRYHSPRCRKRQATEVAKQRQADDDYWSRQPLQVSRFNLTGFECWDIEVLTVWYDLMTRALPHTNLPEYPAPGAPRAEYPPRSRYPDTDDAYAPHYPDTADAKEAGLEFVRWSTTGGDLPYGFSSGPDEGATGHGRAERGTARPIEPMKYSDQAHREAEEFWAQHPEMR